MTLPPGRAPARRVHLSPGAQERIFTGLASGLEAGLPPLACIDAVPLPAATRERLRAWVHAGRPLAQAIAAAGLVQGAERAFLEAGEMRGALPGALLVLGRRRADTRRERGRLLLALLYPTLLLLGLIVLLPLPWIVRDGVGAYAARTLPPLLAIGGLGFVALILFPRLPQDAAPRRGLRRVGLLLPGTRQALREGAMGTYLDVLGASVTAGIPVRQALPLAAEASPLEELQGQAPVELLDQGASLAEAVASLRILPPATLARIAQAETTGTLDRGLAALAAEHRRRGRIAGVVAAVGLAVLAGVAVAGGLAYAVIEGWLHYFDSIESVTTG